MCCDINSDGDGADAAQAALTHVLLGGAYRTDLPYLVMLEVAHSPAMAMVPMSPRGVLLRLSD